MHPFNVFPLQRRVKAKQHITQGNTHRIGRANKQCSEKAKEDNAKQPLHHDLASIGRHVFEQRRGEAHKGMIVQRVVQQSMLCAKTGRSPNRITAQGNTLGNSEPSNLRSERAIGMIFDAY